MDFKSLQSKLEGEIAFDKLTRTIYATDASVYQEFPDAIVTPKSENDIVETIKFAISNNLSIIPRSAGTSLAGQCVGKGIVIDVSKHLNKILEVDVEAKTVWVQPGVIRDELNHHLKQFGLFFGPNTSTANRCMISGMVGNNSCGTSSIKFGSTRDHIRELRTILSDASIANFKNLPLEEALVGSEELSLERKIYTSLVEKLSQKQVQENISKHFPHHEIKRRNTGYAVDALIEQEVFQHGKGKIDLCKILAGSEGTLSFTTAVKLSLNNLPPSERIIVCCHFQSIAETMRAVPIIMKFEPDMCELMDKIILDCTKSNKQLEKNRFFLQGDPAAVLMVQFNRHQKADLETIADSMIAALKENNLSYANPKVYAPEDLKVFELRTAGLGALANIPGDAKAVACIEDTAVRIQDLPNYIAEFETMMKGFNQKAVFYAHAGAGEIHLRPILDLKKQKDVDLFYKITKSVAELVKKYNGSLSGEHGDGRVRAEFIPLMVGDENYELFQTIKKIWDPNNIFNPGKIVHAAPMTSSLRYIPDEIITEPETIFRFSEEGGMIRAAEKCNGSGDCRKLDFSGGTMCPSYKATRNEKDTTRARANALRNFLSHPEDRKNPFDSEELKEVMDLCISCKACGTECPSNVDMTTLKAEFQYQYQKTNGKSLRSRVFANINSANKMASIFYPLSNWALNSNFISSPLKKILNIAPERSLPLVQKVSLRQYYKKYPRAVLTKPIKEVYLFCDEFTNYNEPDIGIKTLNLLGVLNYKVNLIDHPESGRAAFSKGFLSKAKKLANSNVEIFSPIITSDCPLIGIEPSSILSFRDEYPKIVDIPLIEKANKLKNHVFTIEEFLRNEINLGNIHSKQFDNTKRHIAVHGHCHQKALSTIAYTCEILSIPENNTVELIPSGCCGMAGSFGYEKEHYAISMKIGGSVLFPHLNKTAEHTIIAASGTSCRHQIKDGVAKTSFHPIEILWDSLIKEN